MIGRLSELARRPWVGQVLFLEWWAFLLIAVGLFGRGNLPGPAGLPWLEWTLGLGPAAIGLIAFVTWKKEPWRWLVLTAGEALGITLGSVLLTQPRDPLVLLLLWPLVWTALQVPGAAGPGLLGGTGLLYVGLWLARLLPRRVSGRDLLALFLYLMAFVGVFVLVRVLAAVRKEAGRAIPAAQEDQPAPRPEMAPATATNDDLLHQDLRVARDIQVSLLLASSPRLPGWEASTAFLPARELGGDLYDFVELDSTHWGIMIGDVSGKGIPAALHMAVARTLFRIEARNHASPGQTLARINQALIEQIPQGCVTLLYALLDITDGTFHLANAGHNYPLILNAVAREVELDGLPLGIDRDCTFNEATARLEPGDVLILYTDGIVEATNERGELFGFERLYRLLNESTSRRPRSLTRQIVRAVRAFTGPQPQDDDITLVVLRRRYTDRVQEMAEVAADILGPEGGQTLRECLEGLSIPAEAPTEVWRAAILTLAGLVRDRWGPGPSRELVQQLLLTLEGYT
ncbi:MAG: PP2C family protein-serine/threonine phosphatase [Chloroflexia bacterium]